MRGTNPYIGYCLPFGPEMVAKARLSIYFADKLLLQKSTDQMHWRGNNMLCIPLTREETLLLPDDTQVQLQLQIENTGGDHLVDTPRWAYTGQLLNEEELQ